MKKCNTELQCLIAEVDQIVSNWDRPTWISTSENCLSMVESAIDAPQIQKMLWDLKQKSGIGILFMMWSVTIWVQVGNLTIYWVLVSVFVLGITFLLHTLFRSTATEVVNRVREFAFISYIKDSFQSYQPIRYQISDTNKLDAIDRLKESARVLEQVATSGQWKRFDAMYENYLYDMKKVKPRITDTQQRLTTAWLGTFAELHLSKSAGKSVQEHKVWFWSVLEAYQLTGVLDSLRWAIVPSMDNYTKANAFFTLNLENVPQDRVYRDNEYIHPRLDQAFQVQDEGNKILWINAAAEQKHGFPAIMRETIYKFVCNFEGSELIPDVYKKLVVLPGNIENTTMEMLVRVYNILKTDSNWRSRGDNFYDKVQGHSRVPAEIQEKARYYRENLRTRR